MTQNRIRTALMDGAIRVVARDGLDKLTTRSIANECELHDAYIYRYFLDKEDLLKRAFLREDEKLIDIMLESADANDFEELTFEERLRRLWMPAWDYLIDNPEICKFYVRYYYSVHFEKDALEEFKANNEFLKRKFQSIFFSDIDVEMLFHYNLDTMLHIAIRSTTGELPKNDILTEQVFSLMCSINEAYVQKLSELTLDEKGGL